MAQDPGYELITCDPADEGSIAAVLKEISGRLSKSSGESSTLGYETLGWGAKCEELFGFGWEIGNHIKNCEPQGAPAAFILLRNKSQLPRWRTQPGWVIIYRPIKEELRPDVGFFRVIEASHRMSDENIRELQLKEVILEPNKVLVLDGSVVIEYPPPGGGLGLLKAFKKKYIQEEAK